mgnify:CR=1 FL=1
MQTKRTILWTLSAAIGIGLSLLVIMLGFHTTLAKFAYSNVLLLVVSFGAIVFIWGDYLLGTDYLKK